MSAAPSRLGNSILSRYSVSAQRGTRDYYPEQPGEPLDLGKVVPSATYIERGQRWMEKEEAFSLRCALEDMDLERKKKEKKNQGKQTKVAQDKDDEDEDARLHEAALNEAAELVWQHQNGYKQLPPGTPYRYKPHLRRNSYAHARTASVGPHANEIAATGLGRDVSRSVSGSSSGSDRHANFELLTRSSIESVGFRQPRLPTSQIAPGKTRHRSSMKRNISGEIERPFSGDQIWEESCPQSKDESESTEINNVPVHKCAASKESISTGNAKDSVLKDSSKSPLNKLGVHVQGQTSLRRSLPWLSSRNKGPEKTEIHRNPPSQSRNPQYTTNSPTNTSLDGKTPKKNGMEVRSEDIINATSMRLKDRSARLPTPTAVSDNPGRPIVSFDANWKAPKEETDMKIENARNSSASLSKAKQSEAIVPSITVGKDPETMGSASASPCQLPSVQIGSSTFPRRPSPNLPRTSYASIDSEPSIPKTLATKDAETPPEKHAAHPPAPVSPMIDTPGRSQNIRTPPKISASENIGNQVPRVTPLIPTIVTPDDDPKPPAGSRPLPQISVSSGQGEGSKRQSAAPAVPLILRPNDGARPSAGARPLPVPGFHGSLAGIQRPKGHWSPDVTRNTRATAKCHECQLPIEGRFIAVAGISERFHSECFRCYACGTNLEALEISPEPENKRAERLERIRRRAKGEILPEEPGKTAAEDGDERLRFYCHLDWHELYAPRCKHCRTPILGEHIVALGEHWHYGHFFCAECGDPFEQGMTHIEKDGYAWCVNCQTKRTERRAPKCKKCRKGVIGHYIRALGAEWHEKCFLCATCGGGFDDGQVFPRGKNAAGEMVVLCTGCRQRELKA